jgi:DNA-binding IclR family transcriptional regulator
MATSDPAAPSQPARDYTSEPQQVVLTLISALLDTWPEPQTPTTLTSRTGYSRDQVYRGLKNLETQRMAEESATGWLIGPTLTTAPERIRQRAAMMLTTYLGIPA